MQVQSPIVHDRRGIKRALWIGSLVVLFMLLIPMVALAGPPDPIYEGPEKCAQCHPAEATTWGDSTHARALTAIQGPLHTACGEEQPLGECQCLGCHTTHFDASQGSYAHAGVTCEACHGPYLQDHPQSGVMQLPVGASSCESCHANTYQQWHETAHEGANVACTSCHVPHSQDTRLSTEQLCESCHPQEAEHWVHHEADVHCTDCHLAASTAPEISADVRVMAGGEVPDHRFKLAVETCVDCHWESIHGGASPEAAGQMEISQLSELTARTRELAYELDDAKQVNRSLRTVSVVSLGFGLGTGGVLGAIFVLVVGYISQGRRGQ